MNTDNCRIVVSPRLLQLCGSAIGKSGVMRKTRVLQHQAKFLSIRPVFKVHRTRFLLKFLPWQFLTESLYTVKLGFCVALDCALSFPSSFLNHWFVLFTLTNHYASLSFKLLILVFWLVNSNNTNYRFRKLFGKSNAKSGATRNPCYSVYTLWTCICRL